MIELIREIYDVLLLAQCDIYGLCPICGEDAEDGHDEDCKIKLILEKVEKYDIGLG